MKKAIVLVTCCLALSGVGARADQVVMQNGDTLNGKVLAMTATTLTLKDENLGTVALPRAKVKALIFGTGAIISALPATSQTNLMLIGPQALPANPNSDLAKMFQGIRQHTNLIEQVEGQVLGSASPDAQTKFNELLDGLASGQIDMNGLRAQAQSAADELRQYKNELGPEFGPEADTYLAILNGFLKETATNSTSP